MTNRSNSLAKFIISSISHGQPAKCTQIIALVLLEITDLIDSAEIFCELGSISAKTGIALELTIDETEAIKLREVTTTSSPSQISNEFNAASSANVPLATATEYFEFDQIENSFSNSRHSLPVQ